MSENPESCYGWFDVNGLIPSKKNRYRVTKTGKFYLDPKVKQAQTLIAWKAKTNIPKSFPADARLRLDIELGLANDVDGVVTTVMDALELSGRVPNDKQIAEVHVTRKWIGKKTRIKVTQLS